VQQVHISWDRHGDEANLYSGSTVIGKVYYNAGIVAIATGAFVPGGGWGGGAGITHSPHWSGSTAGTLKQVAVTGTIDNICDRTCQSY
jgi:hypothetical protein